MPEETKPIETKGVEKQIKEVVQKVVLEEEVTKLKQQTEKQLTQARQQLTIWDTRVKQLTGSLAGYNSILEKSQKAKSLILESNNTEPKKK